jgi:hypothetical protein
MVNIAVPVEAILEAAKLATIYRTTPGGVRARRIRRYLIRHTLSRLEILLLGCAWVTSKAKKAGRITAR